MHPVKLTKSRLAAVVVQHGYVREPGSAAVETLTRAGGGHGRATVGSWESAPQEILAPLC